MTESVSIRFLRYRVDKKKEEKSEDVSIIFKTFYSVTMNTLNKCERIKSGLRSSLACNYEHVAIAIELLI